ncbi:MAG: hypothetical protein ABI561_09720 [Bradyrhizobium sp.]
MSLANCWGAGIAEITFVGLRRGTLLTYGDVEVNHLALISVGIILQLCRGGAGTLASNVLKDGSDFVGGISGGNDMLNDREKILTALREKPLKIFEVMKRANLPNQEACQSLLLKMRDEGAIKFDIHKGVWHVG